MAWREERLTVHPDAVDLQTSPLRAPPRLRRACTRHAQLAHDRTIAVRRGPSDGKVGRRCQTGSAHIRAQQLSPGVLHSGPRPTCAPSGAQAEGAGMHGKERLRQRSEALARWHGRQQESWERQHGEDGLEAVRCQQREKRRRHFSKLDHGCGKRCWGRVPRVLIAPVGGRLHRRALPARRPTAEEAAALREAWRAETLTAGGRLAKRPCVR